MSDEIGPDTIVGALIDRHPELLPVFAAHGFKMLLNPGVREAVASRVQIADACALRGVPLEPFLTALRAARKDPS
jgi:hypothetical protein